MIFCVSIALPGKPWPGDRHTTSLYGFEPLGIYRYSPTAFLSYDSHKHGMWRVFFDEKTEGIGMPEMRVWRI